jgi:hypothetical protein
MRCGQRLACYHTAIDLGIQSVVDAYLSTREAEARAWQSYTEAHREVNESKGVGAILARSLGEHLLFSGE